MNIIFTYYTLQVSFIALLYRSADRLSIGRLWIRFSLSNDRQTEFSSTVAPLPAQRRLFSSANQMSGLQATDRTSGPVRIDSAHSAAPLPGSTRIIARTLFVTLSRVDRHLGYMKELRRKVTLILGPQSPSEEVTPLYISWCSRCRRLRRRDRRSAQAQRWS